MREGLWGEGGNRPPLSPRAWHTMGACAMPAALGGLPLVDTSLGGAHSLGDPVCFMSLRGGLWTGCLSLRDGLCLGMLAVPRGAHTCIHAGKSDGGRVCVLCVCPWCHTCAWGCLGESASMYTHGSVTVLRTDSAAEHVRAHLPRSSPLSK